MLPVLFEWTFLVAFAFWPCYQTSFLSAPLKQLWQVHAKCLVQFNLFSAVKLVYSCSAAHIDSSQRQCNDRRDGVDPWCRIQWGWGGGWHTGQIVPLSSRSRCAWVGRASGVKYYGRVNCAAPLQSLPYVIGAVTPQDIHTLELSSSLQWYTSQTMFAYQTQFPNVNIFAKDHSISETVLLKQWQLISKTCGS